MIEGVRETECVGVVSFVCQLYVMRLGRCFVSTHVHIDGQPRLQCKHPCFLFASTTPKRLLRSHQATRYDACDGNHAGRRRYR